MSKLVIVALALAITGCVQKTGPSGSSGSSGSSAQAATVAPGSYECTIEVGDEQAPGQCTISSGRGQLLLEQSGAPAGIRGKLSTIDGGYRFSGEYFCAEDGCPEVIETDLFAGDAGEFTGVVALERGALLRITIRR